MTSYVNDMWPGSPQGKDSPSGSGTGHSSRLSSRSRSRSSSARSRSRSSLSSRSSSSRSRSRTRRYRSRSQSRRRHQRNYRRYSRSYSRSRSRSRSRRYRERPQPRAYRRYYRSPSRGRSRSRSRSRGRSYYRRAYVGSRGRRYYGFGRTVYPEAHKSWRNRSRSRSRSRTPLRLSEKDRMELLEIAKANAAKALGTANIDLPASLRTGPLSKDRNYGKQIQGDATKLVEPSGRLNEDVFKTSSESSSQQRSPAFSSGNSVAKPVLQKPAEETAGPPKEDEKNQSAYGQWIPIKKEENSLLLSSPKTALSFKF
ncbi:arginine/serine-rich protein 1 isoform X2 [Gracilinanus agilis]|uniref:arginine/serine-rich protein 1 isoform X1 n=1 Tax=Gracilinanus agilis TaxID=191870 RepID=UPI001CFD2279|nr:arginine/serine-rich protein 1 isoform X1 [Gracilinanus agilis]XP_044523833.1 arginine/serine-rich protein 1 isoform X2 [Gracilinanus agilis]